MKIIKLNATESTNTYLKNLLRKEEVQDGLIVVAREQTKGRGQMTNSWSSKSGQSLTFSMFKRYTSLPVSQNAVITYAVALALEHVLNDLNIPKISIKWPNDIMSYNKKVAGILIENQLYRDTIASSVIGIGLNVNETEFGDLPQATSLKLATGTQFDLDELLEKLVHALHLQMQRVGAKEYARLKDTYETALFRKDKISVFETSSGVIFNGIIKGVTESGALRLEKEDGLVENFQLKEIKMHF